MKEKRISVDEHASYPMFARGQLFGLGEHDLRERVLQTIRRGRVPHRHRSRKHETYHQYFHDNISIYVICEEKEQREYIKCIIKTVIIERGRE